jgi:anti-sigma B factor antagonist
MADASIFSLTVAEAASGPTVLALAGELDMAGTPELQAAFGVLAEARTDEIVVYLSALEFIDSTGINALVTAIRQAHDRGGRAILAAPRPNVRRVLEIVGVAATLRVEDSVDEATQALASDRRAS